MSDANGEPVPPAWFRNALAATASARQVTVAGASVRYRCWGPSGAPAVVLVHGGAAHSRWWDHLAPLLADGWQVAAVDLTGHGDSDRRSRYTLAGWAQETLAVAACLDAPGLPVLVGHSMGGQVALTAALEHGRGLGGVIAVDAAPRPRDDEREALLRSRATRHHRDYPTLAAATARFRPRPEQPAALPYVLDHVARHSFRADAPGQWQLKFDPAVYDRAPLRLEETGEFGCPVVVLRAEHGILNGEAISRLRKQRPEVTVVELPEAHHHPMLDQPLVLLTALRTQLAAWSGSRAVPARQTPAPAAPPARVTADDRPTVTVLDDYQGIALASADWSAIKDKCRVRTLRKHWADPAELVARIGDSEIVVAMRERTALPAPLLAQLPRLRLLVATGQRNHGRPDHRGRQRRPRADHRHDNRAGTKLCDRGRGGAGRRLAAGGRHPAGGQAARPGRPGPPGRRGSPAGPAV